MTPKKTPKNNNTENSETIIAKLRDTIRNLDSTIAIYKNDIDRTLKSLQSKIGANSAEEALEKADSLNQEMAKIEQEKGALLVKIKEEMEKFSELING